MNDILGKIKKVKLFLFDLEGVLLNPQEIKNHNSLQQFYVSLQSFCTKLDRLGLKFAILTAREDDKLTSEIRKIENCQILTSSINKKFLADQVNEKFGIRYENIFYIGDDILDLPLLQAAGVSAAPRSARREVKRVVDYITEGTNGQEIMDEIIHLLKKTD